MIQSSEGKDEQDAGHIQNDTTAAAAATTTTTDDQNDHQQRAAVSWTGGKDCHLALLRTLAAGHSVVALVVFHPVDPVFRAHPLDIQRAQSEALDIPLLMYQVDGDGEGGYKGSYARAVQKLRGEHAVDVLVTGDIDYVGDSKRNFVEHVCEIADCDVRCWLPLWQQKREDLLMEMLDAKLEIIYSCVKTPFFTESWIGRQLDASALSEMAVMAKDGLDMNGERGEYHTIVVDGPMYNKGKHVVLCNQEASELHGRAGQKEDERWWTFSESRSVRVDKRMDE